VADKYVSQSSEQRFELRMKEITSAIHERMSVYEQVLWSGVGFFNAVDAVNRQQWKTYVDSINIAENWPGIQGLGYSVPVTPADKQPHIAAIQREGFADYTIKPVGDRAEYSAIIYLEPFDWRNKRAFGFDMWSNKMRRQAMTRARDTGQASTSGLITLVQETDEDVQKGFLTYVPRYTKGMPLTTVAERRAAFLGWVYAPFRMDNLMQGILGFNSQDVSYKVFDGLVRAETMLFDSQGSNKESINGQSSADYKQTSISLQGREWIIQFENQGVVDVAESRQPVIIAAAGLVIDFLLFYVITALALLQKRAEKLAGEMTAELLASRDNLELLVEQRTAALEEERRLLESRVSERTLELRKEVYQSERLVAALSDSNEELSQFAYAASHDLQEPLRMVVSFTQLVQESYGDRLDDEGREYLEIAATSAIKMRTLISDLLDYARLDQESERFSIVDCNEVAASVIKNLAEVIDRQNAKVSVDQLPLIKGSPVRFTSLIFNLVSNALKYSEQNKPTEIRIELEDLGSQWKFIVADNGIGIKAEYLAKIFKPFKRLHGHDEFSGTGMGLAICQRIVLNMKGKIWAESELGKGSQFIVVLPKKMDY
jgi:signal transduction histidine kinase